MVCYYQFTESSNVRGGPRAHTREAGNQRKETKVDKQIDGEIDGWMGRQAYGRVVRYIIDFISYE